MSKLHSILLKMYYKLSFSPKFREFIINTYRQKIGNPKILKYISTISHPSPEEKEVIDYVSEKGLAFIPYHWADEIRANSKNVIVNYDEQKELPYVLMDSKRLYFPKEWDSTKIQSYYTGVQLIEQEYPLSPHRYLSDGFEISADDIFVDCGAAEGNVSLAVVDKCLKVYLFEPSELWDKPLHATFDPYRDKVEFVKKYISDSSSDTTISLDDFFKERDKPTFIKMDVGGFELKILEGAENILSNDRNRMKIAACTYHLAEDEFELTTFLTDKGFTVHPSYGYMIFGNSPQRFPYLRRGVIRAEK